MNWITEEANKNNQREHDEAERGRILSASNYWARLVRQLEADVNAINNHDYWKKKLAEFPLRFGSDLSGNGYQISKSGDAAVLVVVESLDNGVLVSRRFREDPHGPVVGPLFKANETLTAKVIDRTTVALVTEDNKSLIVPEDASQYILKPIIESLKFAVSVP